MRAQARFTRTLILASAALVFLLVCAALVANWGEQSIDDAESKLALSALPSVEHLTEACDALRDLQVHADAYSEHTEAEGREKLEGDWRRVDAALAAYRALPTSSGETEIYDATVPPALRAVTAALTRLTSAIEAQDLDAARLSADREVRVATNEAAGRLRHLVLLNAAQAYDGVQGLVGAHRRIARLGLVFDAVAVLFGIGLGALLLSQFRTHDRLAREHATLLEERAHELEVFGERVAHDLLSPLSALTYCLSAFKRVAEPEPKLQDALSRARACVARAQKMVDAIFEFSRAGGRPPPGARADVRDIVDQAKDELRTALVTESDRALVTVEPFDPCVVACTPGVLASILGNLMGNAAKYLSDSVERRIVVRVREGAETVRIEVEDSGPGVPKTVATRIFDPYVRAEGLTQGGLGLGLATVRRLCEAHGGEVGLRAAAARGSVFWFVLPKAPAAAVADEPASLPVSAAVRRIR
jgi:signal transduction histidine kinase